MKRYGVPATPSFPFLAGNVSGCFFPLPIGLSHKLPEFDPTDKCSLSPISKSIVGLTRRNKAKEEVDERYVRYIINSLFFHETIHLFRPLVRNREIPERVVKILEKAKVSFREVSADFDDIWPYAKICRLEKMEVPQVSLLREVRFKSGCIAVDCGSSSVKVVSIDEEQRAHLRICKREPDLQGEKGYFFTGIKSALKVHNSRYISELEALKEVWEFLRRKYGECSLVDVGAYDLKIISKGAVRVYHYCLTKLGFLRQLLVEEGPSSSGDSFLSLERRVCPSTLLRSLLDAAFFGLRVDIEYSLGHYLGENLRSLLQQGATRVFLSGGNAQSQMFLQGFQLGIGRTFQLTGIFEARFVTALGVLFKANKNRTVTLHFAPAHSRRLTQPVFRPKVKGSLAEKLTDLPERPFRCSCEPLQEMFAFVLSQKVLFLPKKFEVDPPFRECPIYKTPDIFRYTFREIKEVDFELAETPCATFCQQLYSPKPRFVDVSCTLAAFARKRPLLPSEATSIASHTEAQVEIPGTFQGSTISKFCAFLSLAGQLRLPLAEDAADMCLLRFFPREKPNFQLMTELFSESLRVLENPKKVLISIPPIMSLFLLAFRELRDCMPISLILKGLPRDWPPFREFTKEYTKRLLELSSQFRLPLEFAIAASAIETVTRLGIDAVIALDRRCPLSIFIVKRVKKIYPKIRFYSLEELEWIRTKSFLRRFFEKKE